MKPARWILDNGLTVLYQPSAGIPLSAATLLLRCGTLYEPHQDSGVANLSTELLLQGTKRRSAEQIADMMESIGASLGGQCSEDYTEFGFLTPTTMVPRAFDVLGDVLMNPSFAPREIEKERELTLAGLKSRQDTIFHRAYDRFNELMYGTHPYGRPTDGRPEIVRRLKRTQLAQWHDQFIRPERTILSFVSSLSALEARRVVEKTLGRWKPKNSGPQTPFAAAPQVSTSVSDRLHGPFEQAYLMTGMRAPKALDEQSITLKVLNTLWGGGMSSRLFLRLREKYGLAYEVSSFYPTHIAASQWVTYLGCPPERLAQATELLSQMMDDLRRKSPSAAEVAQSIQMIKGAYVMEYQTRRRRAWYTGWWTFLGKDPDYADEFLRKLEDIKPRQVADLAAQLLSEPRVTVTVLPQGKKG